MRDEVAGDAKLVTERLGRPPSLVAVESAREGATRVFGKSKRRASRECGLDARHVKIDPAEGEAAFARCLRELSLDPLVDAVTLERPLPRGFDVVALQELIAPEKDVEG